MGLYVSHITTLPADQERALYVYLLDYGWPEGEFENIFRNHFQSLARRASETGAIVIASHRGVHFANEVLNFHRVFEFDSEDILPAILITKTHPSYFVESYNIDDKPTNDYGTDELHNDNVILIPLRQACTNPQDFSSLMESIFSDLEAGVELRNFRVSKHDARIQPQDSLTRKTMRRLGKSIILEPNFMGIGVNLKELLRPQSE